MTPLIEVAAWGAVNSSSRYARRLCSVDRIRARRTACSACPGSRRRPGCPCRRRPTSSRCVSVSWFIVPFLPCVRPDVCVRSRSHSNARVDSISSVQRQRQLPVGAARHVHPGLVAEVEHVLERRDRERGHRFPRQAQQRRRHLDAAPPGARVAPHARCCSSTGPRTSRAWSVVVGARVHDRVRNVVVGQVRVVRRPSKANWSTRMPGRPNRSRSAARPA